MDETLNGVVTQEVAEPAGAEVASQPTAEAEQTVDQTGVTADAADQQLTENQKWEIARKRAEREAQAKIEKTRQEHQKLLQALKDAGINGSDTQDMILQLRAQKEGIPYEQLKQQEEQQQARIRQAVETSPEMQMAKQIVQKQKFSDDLTAIKRAYPDVKAEDVNELGGVYLELMAAAERGGIQFDPVVAYEAQLAHDRRTTKPTPPSTGPARGTAEEEKDYYTSDELDRLTSKQLDDPAIFEKAYRSMKKLR